MGLTSKPLFWFYIEYLGSADQVKWKKKKKKVLSVIIQFVNKVTSHEKMKACCK